MHTNALRLSRLPVNLRHLVFLQFRCVVTSADDHNVDIPYPFPLHTNPTPYDIFHLPRGATQSQIKARCMFSYIFSGSVELVHVLFSLFDYLDYELVRVYHPDCPAARRLPPNTSHSRFQAISNAYAILSGKRPDGMSSSPSHTRYSRDTQYYEEIARRKRAEWRGPAGSDEFGYGPGLWDKKEKETFEQSMLVVTIAFVSPPSHLYFFLWLREGTAFFRPWLRQSCLSCGCLPFREINVTMRHLSI